MPLPPEEVSADGGVVDPNADLWAAAEETREEILDLYRRVAGRDASRLTIPIDAG